MNEKALGNLLSDEDFFSQFEALTLDPVHFTHLGHLRLGWLYLERYDTASAIDRACKGIKAYAESLGASTKFNLTMTNAFIRIIAARKKLKATDLKNLSQTE